jgi:glycosyltransferase involved in cell wall biosynthesis
MLKVTIDMSPVLHGSRAVKRCTDCLVRELVEHREIEFNLLYIYYLKAAKNYVIPADKHIHVRKVRLPYKVLIPMWRRLAWLPYEKLLPQGDLLYTNEFYFMPVKNYPTLATIHGLSYKIIPQKFPPDVVRRLNRGLEYILTHADYFIAVSENTKTELIDVLNVAPERIYVVTHGIDKRFQPRADQDAIRSFLKIRFNVSQPYILYVGAIGHHKNIMGLLTAFKRLSDKIAHDLVLVGPPDSAWNAARRYTIDQKISNRIHFIGHVHETQELITLYQGAELFVFPSFYEGWTSPPLEAMACGTPVITSNISSIPETVGRAALLIDPYKTEELTQAMEYVLNSSGVAEDLIRMGLEHASQHTWKDAADKMITVFSDICRTGFWEGHSGEHRH